METSNANGLQSHTRLHRSNVIHISYSIIFRLYLYTKCER